MEPVPIKAYYTRGKATCQAESGKNQGACKDTASGVLVKVERENEPDKARPLADSLLRDGLASRSCQRLGE